MDHFELSAKSPSLDLTDHQPAPPIFSSTPLILDDKPPAPPSSSTASSFFLPLTENSQNNDQLVKLNEDLCLLGLFDFVPKTLNIDQTVLACRQLVKNYNKLSHDKHVLHEKLRKHEVEQVQSDKRQDTSKHSIDRLQSAQERLSDDIQGRANEINQLTQTIRTKDKEIRRLNQLFAQQSALAKHQYRTLEKNVDKLKERISNFEKNRFAVATIDYSWPLLLNESTTVSSSTSSSDALLKKICYDYDQKHRLLMIENDQLRQCLVGIDDRFERLLLIHRSPTEGVQERSTDEQSFETQLMHLPCHAVSEIVQRHFGRIYDQLDRYLLHSKAPTNPSKNKRQILFRPIFALVLMSSSVKNAATAAAPVVKRDINKWLFRVREFLMLRKFTHNQRHEFEMSKRTHPPPLLPGGFAHKLSKNYYLDRDARRAVAQPQVVFSHTMTHAAVASGAAQQQLTAGTTTPATATAVNTSPLLSIPEVEKQTAALLAAGKHIQNNGRTPGKIYNWDG